MKFDVIIVGGGLAGASLAVALSRGRLRIALIDGGPPIRTSGWDSRIYAYSPANVAFLQTLGVWERLDLSRTCAIHDMEVFGDRGGALRFSAGDCGVDALAWIAESSLVHLELWESLKRQHNVQLFAPTVPASLEVQEDVAEVELDTGLRMTGRLLVGADGRNSWVRARAGIDAREVVYDELAIVANFACSRPHGNRALQWFCDDGIVAWLPMAGNNMSMVWSAKKQRAEEIMATDDDTFTRMVAEAGEKAFGELSLITPRARFPLKFMRVSSVVSKRVALVGDAAHAIHPLSGHGINLGFQDAKVLSQKLLDLPEWGDPGDERILRAYARERAEEPCLVQYVTHGINRLFNIRHPLAVAARNFGLNLTDRLPVVRNALTRYAVSGKF